MADELPELKVGDQVLYWPSAYDETRKGIGPIGAEDRPAKAKIVFVHGQTCLDLRVRLKDGRVFVMEKACPVLEHFPGGGAGAHRKTGTCFEREES